MAFLLYLVAFGAAVSGWMGLMSFGAVLGRYRRAEAGHGAAGAVDRDALVKELLLQLCGGAGLIIIAILIAAYAAHLG